MGVSFLVSYVSCTGVMGVTCPIRDHNRPLCVLRTPGLLERICGRRLTELPIIANMVA
jgi:hypothetical protein